MVVWTDYLTSIADAIGTTATEAGLIFSLIFTMGIILVVVIATKGRKPQVTMPLSAFFPTLLFTFMGWYPIWTGSAIALVLAIFIAYVFSRW